MFKLIVARIPRVYPFQRMRFKFWEFRINGMEKVAKATFELFFPPHGLHHISFITLIQFDAVHFLEFFLLTAQK